MSKNSPKIVRNEYDILKEYSPGVIQVLSVYTEKRKVAGLCKESLDGLNPVILTRIIQGDRPLSPFVLKKLLLSGVVTLKDILQDRSFEEIPDNHKVLLMRLLMTDSFILKLAAFPNLNDVEKIIDRALKKIKKQPLKTILQSLYFK